MFGRKYAGTVLIILGAVFLLGSITGMDLSLWKWWPALPIAAGLLGISKGGWKGGLIVVGPVLGYPAKQPGRVEDRRVGAVACPAYCTGPRDNLR